MNVKKALENYVAAQEKRSPVDPRLVAERIKKVNDAISEEAKRLRRDKEALGR